jgi:hypothetical protein
MIDTYTKLSFLFLRLSSSSSAAIHSVPLWKHILFRSVLHMLRFDGYVLR